MPTHHTQSTHHTHLSVEDVTFTYPDRRVLTGISFAAAHGDRIGLIGENGAGKSTLLRLLAGLDTPDSGVITLSGTVGLLEQQLPYLNHTPVSRILDDAQREKLDLLSDLEKFGAQIAARPDNGEAARAYSDALTKAAHLDVWAAESRRGEVLSGFGLGGVNESRRIGELSGGQQLRLALAALILRAPYLLLLDEPTNHLDDTAAKFLEQVLSSWPGIIIVASHDRSFLDAVTTRMLDLDPLPVTAAELADAEASEDKTTEPATSTTDPGTGFGIQVWGVGYREARRERRAAMQRWRERYEREDSEARALNHEIAVGAHEVNRKHEPKSEVRMARKYYADKDARVTARRARNASVRLATLERERVRRPPEPLRFRGFDNEPTAEVTSAASTPRAAPSDRPDPVLTAHRVSVTGRLSEVSLDLTANGRLLVTGPNGSGKSTLLSLLAGALEPTGGTIKGDARVGFLPQEVEFLRPDRTAAVTYRSAVGHEISEQFPLADTGLLAPRDIDRPVGHLSVGQRRRVALAALVANPPPILVLDEPTNHLSLTLVEELEAALRHYRGAVVIATHDRWIRSRWEGQHLELG